MATCRLFRTIPESGWLMTHLVSFSENDRLPFLLKSFRNLWCGGENGSASTVALKELCTFITKSSTGGSVEGVVCQDLSLYGSVGGSVKICQGVCQDMSLYVFRIVTVEAAYRR